MTPDEPTLSIITPVLNGVGGIAGAIESVAAQGVPVEHIVVDGGSTDGTLDIIADYHRRGFVTRYVSEKDNGIADALNRGIAMATGSCIGIVHSDDIFLPGAFSAVIDAAKRAPGAVIHGDIVLRETGTRVSPRPFPRLWKYVDFPYNHVAMFVPAAVYRDVGGYDTRYRLAMDYDFFLRATNRQVPFVYVPKPLSGFSLGGASTRDPRRCHREVFQSQIENGLFSPVCQATYLLKLAVNSLKKVAAHGK